MSSTVKVLYGSNNQTITITYTSLVNNALRGSVAIDNTSNLFLDALVQIKFKTAAAGTASTGLVNVYAYGTANGGTDYGDAVAGTDSAPTLTSPPNLRLLMVVNAVVNSTTYVSNPASVAALFGGYLPAHWGIVIENKTSATLDASVASAWYQGVQQQIV